VLDRLYREQIGAEVSDLLLERGIHLDYLLGRDGRHLAYGRMGGWTEWGDGGKASRCLVASGASKQEAVRELVTGTPAVYHAPNLKSSLWAFGEACELLAEAYHGS
jgi:hypothetical protein